MESKVKILVIDDENGIREGCARALEPQGFEVAKAGTLREGLARFKSGNFELVLLDIMLPDGRGITILEPIHAQDPDAVCIIITGYATVELAVEAIKYGAYDFIAKPFTSDQLLLTVNQGLEKRRLSLEARRLQQIEQRAAELARSQAEMERLDQQKSAFMTTVAHELRAPIGGAQSLLRTILRGLAGELNAQQRQMLLRVEARLDTLLELVNDLLDLAASKTLESDRALSAVDLATMVQEVVDHYQVEAQAKDIRLIFEHPEPVLEVWGTPEGLGRICSNLLGNAIKYTPDGGQVEVALRSELGQVSMAVSDTGIGIPAEDLPQLFEEFFRARNAKRAGISGTGLGLSIVKELVERFGGQVDVESSPGQGSTFTVTLPAAQGEPPAGQSQPEAETMQEEIM